MKEGTFTTKMIPAEKRSGEFPRDPIPTSTSKGSLVSRLLKSTVETSGTGYRVATSPMLWLIRLLTALSTAVWVILFVSFSGLFVLLTMVYLEIGRASCRE